MKPNLSKERIRTSTNKWIDWHVAQAIVCGVMLATAVGGETTKEMHPAPKPAIPESLCQTGILVKGQVVSVSESQSKFTENSWTEIVLTVSQVYRGEGTKGEEVKFSIEGWLESEKEKADFFRRAKKNGKEVIVPLKKTYNPFLKKFGNNYGGYMFLPSGDSVIATDDNVRHAEDTAMLPIGWNYGEKGLVSPWPAVDNAKFTVGDETKADGVCSKTGRPAYLTDDRLEMKVDLKREDRPYVFKVSIKNPTDKATRVESLRSSKGKILWDESVLFVNHENVWLPVGFEGFTANTEAAVIEPGQTLEGELPWQAQYDFDTLVCLGNKSFSIYINLACNFDLYMKEGKHPKPPFQSKKAKF